MISQKSLAVALSLMLIIIMGTMHRTYASHITQHTHHTAATHSTEVCSWMCAAAQTISGETPFLWHRPQILAIFEWIVPKFPALTPVNFLPTRAPPQ